MVIFKDVIAWDERTPVDGEMGVVSSLRGTVAIVPTAERPRVDLNACRKYGPSYRKLPKHVSWYQFVGFSCFSFCLHVHRKCLWHVREGMRCVGRS